MKKRFGKILSMLLAIALLVSGIAAVFAEGEEPAAETIVAEEASINNEAPAEAPAEAAPAAEVQPEAPAAEAAPVEAAPVEAAPVEAAPVEAAPAEAAPAAEEPAPAPETVEASPVAETPVAEAPAEAAPVEETPAAETQPEAPAAEVPAVEEAPAQEETPAAETETVEEVINNEETPSEEFVDELADGNDEIAEEDIQVLDDDGGYIDPEVVAEHIPEVTPELKYNCIAELKVGSRVDGIANEGACYSIKPAFTQTVILGLYADAPVQVKVDDKAVKFIADETVANFATCEVKLTGDTTHIIELSGNNVAFTLTVEKKTAEAADEQSAAPAADEAAQEEVTEEPAEEVTEEVVPAEDNNEETDTEETVTEETETTDTEETGNTENNTEEISNNEAEEEGNGNTGDEIKEDAEITEEETVAPMVGWINVDAAEFAIGDTATLTAESDVDLENQVVWQTKTEDGDWTKFAYGNIVKVELTEENAANSYRFRMVDGSFSDELRLTVTEPQTEENTEEAAEEQTEVEAEPVEDKMDEEAVEDEPTNEAAAETAEKEPAEEVLEETVDEAGFDHEDVLDVSVEYSDENPVFGTIATLKATLTGFEEETDYVIQWQYSTDNEIWVDIEGENEQEYPVEITLENYRNYWRAVVRYKDATATEGQNNP